MKTARAVPVYMGLLLLAVSTGIYLQMLADSRFFTILDHGFRPRIGVLIPVTAVLMILFMLLWKGLPKWEARFCRVDRIRLERESLLSLLPLGLTLISPLLLKYYTTQDDLRTRLYFLGAVVLGGYIILKGMQYHRHRKSTAGPEQLLEKFQGLPLKTKLLILFFLAFFLYLASAGMIVSQGRAFSGDEPYYLLTAHSLYQDQDINVANNYANNDYRHFYPPDLYPRLRLPPYARFGHKGDGYIYPVSQPGVSALILPQYALSRLFRGRILIFILKSSLAVWAALLGLQLYLLSSELWNREKVSLVLWLAFSFSAPVLFYAVHIYPEIPVMLFAVYIFRKARASRPLSPLQYLFCGGLLALFPWFGLKFNMLFWPLLLVAAVLFLKDHKAGLRLGYFLALPLLSLGLFYVYVHYMYGTFNPISLYDGILTPDKLTNFRDVMLKTPLMLRIDSFFDYFLDQRDGLLLYSPVYFFAFLGIVEAFRRARRDLLLLLLIAAPYVFNYAFFAHRQGSCPQGRVLAPLTWIAALFIGYFLVHNRKKLYTGLFYAAGGLSLIIVLLLLQNPGFLYQPTTHGFTFRGGDLFVHLSNLLVYLPDYLPSFLKINNLGHIPNYVWLSLLVIFIAGYASKRACSGLRSWTAVSAATTAGLALLILLGALYPRMVLLFPQRADFSGVGRIGFYGLSRTTRMRNPGEFDILEDNRSYSFTFTSRRALGTLEMAFGSLQGTYDIEIQLFDHVVFAGRTDKEIKTVIAPAPPRYPYKRTYLYQVNLRLSNISDVETDLHPYTLRIRPAR